MKDKVSQVLNEAVNELLSLPKDEFEKLLKEHSEGEIAQLLRHSGAFKSEKKETVTISKADLSYAIDRCTPSVLDGVGNALFNKLWNALEENQGKCFLIEKESKDE